MLIQKVSFNNNQKSKSQSTFKSRATQGIIRGTMKELGFSQAARESAITESEIPIRNLFSRAMDVLQEKYSEITTVGRRGPYKSYMNEDVEINHLAFKNEDESIGVNSLYNHKTKDASLEYYEITTNGRGDAFVNSIKYALGQENKSISIKKASGDLSLVEV